MSKYGFDQEEVLISKKVYIDKDGFYHEEYVEESDDSDDSESETAELTEGYYNTVSVGTNEAPAAWFVFVINDAIGATVPPPVPMLYFGDAIADEDIQVELSSGNVIFSNAQTLGLISPPLGSSSVPLDDEKGLYGYNLGGDYLPEGWENMKVHLVLGLVENAGEANESAALYQLHQP